MAGGTFDRLVGKVRPGTYINFESTRHDVVGNNARGIVVIPLLGHDYGPAKEFFNLYSSAPDAEISKLGYSVYDDNDNMLLIREAFKHARQVIVYIAGPDKKATATVGDALTVTAKYGGTLGNSLKVVIANNAAGGFDVSVYLGTTQVFLQEGATNISDLAENDYVTFSGEGALTENAGTNLTGGSNSESNAKDFTEFLDSVEKQIFNTLCVTTTEESALTAAITKVKYLREEAGRGVQFVMADKTADYEGVINVTNSVVIDGKKLSHMQACAWVAGISASASEIVSNTYVPYDGATDIVDEKTHEEAVKAIKNGELFFSKDTSGKVVVEYDINSLVTYPQTKDKSYSKNRTIRVFDSFKESLQNNFPPNKFDNDESGWLVMEGIGKAILGQFETEGAITNVDYDNDFKVDKSLTSGDETYFIVGLQPVDSAEKLFFTVKTR